MMNYDQTIDYLFTRLPMFSRIGAAAFKKDLTNTINLCEWLGNPQQQLKTIHIAGTNGKGSVSHMLAAIFQQAGYKTGLYTSPHLKDFRERIRVNGEMIDKEFVVDFTDKIKDKITEIEPSFFEITVAMAFDYFAAQKVDIAIIETGLGGRLDSTNIIRPELSVITNIGMDHMNMLGDTLEKIAGEKAGIIKKEIPVIIGERNTVTDPVFIQKAEEQKAAIIFAADKKQATPPVWKEQYLVTMVTDVQSGKKREYQLDLAGIYQTKNLVTVLTACDLLSKQCWDISDDTIANALRQVKQLTGLHGRWEVLRKEPLLVVDVAHNEDGIRQLTEQIKLTPHKELHIVLGMVKDKDIQNVLHLLPKDANYYFTRAAIPRALPEDELMKMAGKAGLSGKKFSNVNFALYSASLKAGKKDLIIVCGSIFLAGEVSLTAIREIWGKEEYATAGFEAIEMAAWAFFK